MEALMRQEAKRVIDDHNAATGLYDGIVYMMHIRGGDGGVVPCYIGKSETVGKTSGVLSANLNRLATDRSKFGRWGDNYAIISEILVLWFCPAMTQQFRQRSIDPGQQLSSKALTQITLGRANRCSFGSEPGKGRTWGSGRSLGQLD